MVSIVSQAFMSKLSSKKQTKKVSSTIADRELDKMYNEINEKVEAQLKQIVITPTKITTKRKRVTFSDEVTQHTIKRLWTTARERQQLWQSSPDKIMTAARFKRTEPFWQRNTRYQWTIDQDAWKAYMRRETKAKQRSRIAYDLSLQPDAGLY